MTKPLGYAGRLQSITAGNVPLLPPPEPRP
jgi:hypothetical protein